MTDETPDQEQEPTPTPETPAEPEPGVREVVDQDQIDALLRQVASVGEAEPEPAADPLAEPAELLTAPDDSGPLLSQDTLNALLAGEGGFDSEDLTTPEPAGDAPASGGLVDHAALDALWSRVSATDSPTTPFVGEARGGRSVGELDLLGDVVLTVSAEIGRTDMTIEEVLKIAPGSLIELDKLAGEPVELFVNDHCVAYGEVVVVEDSFGVRITELAGRKT